MKLYLILGCWGRDEEGFKSCSSIQNKILELTNQTERNREIIDFLDDNYKLIDKPLYSNVHTVLFSVQDTFSHKGKPVFDKVLFHKIEDFCQTHRKCGLFLRLSLEEEQ